MGRKIGSRRRACVQAEVRGLGNIKEWTTASSEKQAVFQVAKMLEKKYPRMVIFLKDWTVTWEEKTPS